MDLNLPMRVLAAARHHAPTPVHRGKLMPFREAVLTHLAKGSSYEVIAAFFKGFGVQIEASAVGNFCRRHCPAAEIERARRELIVAATGTVPVLPSKPTGPATTGPKRQNPRIARDDL
jgi:hypothetical protein